MRLRLRWLILSILLLAALPALADVKPTSFEFPPDDGDLQQVISAAAAYQAAASCDMECPKTDCAAAKEALQALSDMQSYLQELVTALGAANADALAHFQNLAKNSITNADQQAKTIWAIGVHEALHNFGSALLSIASVASFAKDFATNPKAFEDLSPVEMLDRLNSWASALRSLESGINTLAKAQGAPTSTPITGKFDIAGGVDTKSINDQISTINDIKKTINAAIKNGKDWKSALSKSGGAAALGQLAGRFLKLYSEDLLKERKAAMEELLRDAAAGDLVQAQSYLALQRIQVRRFLAEDALLAVQNAFDAYAACVAKVCGASTMARPSIPNFTTQVQGAGKKYSWGQALRWLNGAIQATLPRLVPVGFRNDCMRTAEQQPFEFILGWGSTTWCQYDPWAPMTPIPGGGPATTGGEPKTVDGGGGPQQADGGGSTPTPTSSGSTPSASSSGSTPGPTPQGGAQTSDGGGTTPPPESILDDIDEDDDDHEDDPKGVPTVPLIIKATAQAQAAGATQSAIGSQQIKLFPDSVQNVALPSPGAEKPQTDAGADPVTCTTGKDGACMVHVNPCDFGACVPGAPLPTTPMEIEIAPSAVTSFNLEVRPGTPLIAGLTPYQTDALLVGGRSFLTVTGPLAMGPQLRNMIGGQPGLISFEENFCRDKQAGAPNDPYFAGKGAWGQKHDDQWALKRIGLTAGKESAWNLLGAKPQPVTVAVIDTGLDWNHLDFDWASLWRNPREKPDNKKDDDGNGFVDDVIGWDFLGNTNRPWDHDGHGTLVTGIIAAASNNKAGIAGINPHARIMVLKALNAFGQTRASFIAKAITYAADNGARIVNLSVGGKNLTAIEKAAIAHARGKGVLIVVAAGNEGIEAKEFGPAGADGVLTVAATNLDDSHPAFSNWGPEIDLAAPGVDILSLRARRTDTVLGVPGVEYKAGSAYVGKDKRYYRVSGTSFAAPFVAGVASLVLSKNPALTVDQLEAVLKNSAEDIQVPGLDQFSGAGMVHAARALSVDPAFSIQAAITGVEVVQLSGKPAVSVLGSAAADAFAGARLELGEGENPKKFKTAIADVPATAGASLGAIPADSFRGSRLWTIRLLVSHRNGQTREARYLLDTGQ